MEQMHGEFLPGEGLDNDRDEAGFLSEDVAASGNDKRGGGNGKLCIITCPFDSKTTLETLKGLLRQQDENRLLQEENERHRLCMKLQTDWKEHYDKSLWFEQKYMNIRCKHARENVCLRRATETRQAGDIRQQREVQERLHREQNERVNYNTDANLNCFRQPVHLTFFTPGSMCRADLPA